MRCLAPIGLATCLWLSAAAGEPAYTPEPGSVERTAICDALREHFIEGGLARVEEGAGALPEEVRWRVDEMRVEGNFAWFGGGPVFASGAPTGDWLVDAEYNAWLEREDGRWRVKVGTMRGDVPSVGELLETHAQLSRDFPQDLATGVFALPQPEIVDGRPRIVTPERGTPARRGIADALRAEFTDWGGKDGYRVHTDRVELPEKVVWTFAELKVCGAWAYAAASPQFESGRGIDDWLVTTDFMAILVHPGYAEDGHWEVVLDLSRGDVPAPGEVRELQRRLPANFPQELLPEFYRAVE